jgi:hypothetical protein
LVNDQLVFCSIPADDLSPQPFEAFVVKAEGGCHLVPIAGADQVTLVLS